MVRRPYRLLAGALALSVALAGCTPRSATPQSSPGAPSSPGPVSATVASGLSHPVADPLYPARGNAGLDVLGYQLDLTWAPPARLLTGTATLTVRAAAPVTDLSLDFADSYTVDGVTVDGRSATPSRRGNELVVPAGHPLAVDDRATLVVRYHGTPAAVPGPSARNDFAEGLGLRATSTGEAWTMQEPYGAYTWYPVNDQPSDKATYDIAVTVPPGWSAVASGTPGGVTQTPAGETFRWRSPVPVASYLTTLAVGHYTELTDTDPAGVPLQYWIRTGRDESLVPALRKTPQLIGWLERHFGPYPFPSAGIVVVDSTSAMETQQMVTYGAAIRGGPKASVTQVDEVILHELAHQWFGDAVTPTTWLDLWLNEGWAMYAEWMWSVDSGLRTDADWTADARYQDNGARAKAGPGGHPHADDFGEDNVYFGPALMLREIRLAIGDQAFFSLAGDWVQQQRYASVDRAGFIAFVNAHTGHDFTALINDWLDSPTTPKA